jgi:hypothetical protein
MDLPPWPADLPADAVRAETRALADAMVEVLRTRLGDDTIRGVYLKGSAAKPWDSAIDYVPTQSDVDIHLALDTTTAAGALADLDVALETAEALRAGFLRRVPRPLHLPKPQLTLVAALHELPGYVPSPASTVVTLFGEPYEGAALGAEEQDAQRDRDGENLLAQRDFVEALPMRAIDRPGPYLRRILDELPWRVSPVAPRVLSVLGGTYEDVWSANRTMLVRALEARGQGALAEAYAGYYLAGWRVFRGDESALLEAVRAGVRAMVLGQEVAQRRG